MKKKDIDDNLEFNGIEYKQRCHNKNCDNVMSLFTQRDDYPEYHTTVGVKCNKCNCMVWFSLPVN